MKKTVRSMGTVLILIAGVFWGSMGLFVRRLGELGFSSVQIVSMRLCVAAVLFALLLLWKDPAGFRLRLRDIPLFLGLGFGSILFFTCCYFTAIRMMPMSVAAILLYTSPIWVMLMSALFFRTKITRRKVAALLLSFFGCVLVSGISGGGVTLLGFFIGIGSGIGYGLYSILGTAALQRYSPYTVTTYTFLLAAFGSVFICKPAEMIHTIANAEHLGMLLVFLFLTGLLTAFVPFLCYTIGLNTVEAGRAAILATSEPMVAAILGAVVYHEMLTPLSCLGILCIFAAIVLLNLRQK